VTERNEKLTESEFQADDGRHWYVIHTYSGYENKVKQNLMHRIETMEMQDQIFRVIVPTEEEIEIKNGQRRTVHKKVFPGYVLVQMRMNDNSWYVVRNTPGVTSFVGHGNRPTPLEDSEVKAILKQMRRRHQRFASATKLARRSKSPMDPSPILRGSWMRSITSADVYVCWCRSLGAKPRLSWTFCR